MSYFSRGVKDASATYSLTLDSGAPHAPSWSSQSLVRFSKPALVLQASKDGWAGALDAAPARERALARLLPAADAYFTLFDTAPISSWTTAMALATEATLTVTSRLLTALEAWSERQLAQGHPPTPLEEFIYLSLWEAVKQQERPLDLWEPFEKLVPQLAATAESHTGDWFLLAALRNPLPLLLGTPYYLPLGGVTTPEDLLTLTPERAEAILAVLAALGAYNYPRDYPLEDFFSYRKFAPAGVLTPEAWVNLAQGRVNNYRTTTYGSTLAFSSFFEWCAEVSLTRDEFEELAPRVKVKKQALREGETVDVGVILAKFAEALESKRSCSGTTRAFGVYCRTMVAVGPCDEKLHTRAHALFLTRAHSGTYLNFFEEWVEEVEALPSGARHQLNLLLEVGKSRGKGLSGFTLEEAYLMGQGVVKPLELVANMKAVMSESTTTIITREQWRYFVEHHSVLRGAHLSWWQPLAKAALTPEEQEEG